jgi:predicted nucleic acid-binding protein
VNARFPLPLLRLTARGYRAFLRDLPDRGVTGGGVYDALVAATAAQHRAELFTCDRRALPIYEAYGVRSHFV